uniref:Uncharacterized protein n=1 Tax=Solanum lycopersicum TaxID=4081 RepID=A0A3Q7GJC7_SOLLC
MSSIYSQQDFPVRRHEKRVSYFNLFQLLSNLRIGESLLDLIHCITRRDR